MHLHCFGLNADFVRGSTARYMLVCQCFACYNFANFGLLF